MVSEKRGINNFYMIGAAIVVLGIAIVIGMIFTAKSPEKTNLEAPPEQPQVHEGTKSYQEGNKYIDTSLKLIGALDKGNGNYYDSLDCKDNACEKIDVKSGREGLQYIELSYYFYVRYLLTKDQADRQNMINMIEGFLKEAESMSYMPHVYPPLIRILNSGALAGSAAEAKLRSNVVAVLDKGFTMFPDTPVTFAPSALNYYETSAPPLPSYNGNNQYPENEIQSYLHQYGRAASAYALGYKLTGDTKYTNAAKQIISYGHLWYANLKEPIPLDTTDTYKTNYCYLVQAQMELLDATGDSSYLDHVKKFFDKVDFRTLYLREFDPGLRHLNSNEMSLADVYSAIPCADSLVKLSKITNEASYNDAADKMLIYLYRANSDSTGQGIITVAGSEKSVLENAWFAQIAYESGLEG